jgi:signal peptidase II
MKSIRNILTNGRMAVIIVIAILLVDQIIKVWVKTHMHLHECIAITDWFKICFIENKGMAFGMEIGSKLVLSVFRIFAVCVIGYYIYLQVKQKVRTGYIICLSMVLAGALGNIIDCMFYGLIFNASSPFYVSYFVPFGDGYAPFLMGKVVDMFYFPLIVTTWPDWIPVVGGDDFVFFSPIFNFADAAISCGIIAILIFYHKRLNDFMSKKSEQNA